MGRKKLNQTNANGNYERECGECGKILEYTDRSNWLRAIKKNGLCGVCSSAKKFTPEVKEKLRESALKIDRAKIDYSIKGNPKQVFRNCPDCGREMGYVSEAHLKRAIKLNTICNSCSSYKYKKAFKYVIKPEHIQKMAAKKAGYDSYDEYVNDLDNKDNYYYLVRKMTEEQPLHTLENYDKPRGLCGVPGAYQVDHIIPISEGYRQRIPPHIIADIKNLRIISWEDNRSKSSNSI